MSDDGDWFAPKLFGYGAGVPIAWQGWAVLVGFVVVIGTAAATLMPRHPAIFVAVALVAGLALTVIAAQHTRGGWRWRWGGTDDSRSGR